VKPVSAALKPWWPWVLALAPLLGCGKHSPPQPADPDQAREALRLALEAWKRGEPADVLQENQPPIHVADHEWRAGCRLIRYQVAGRDQALGSNLCCRVTLWMKDQRGKAVQRKAVYSVGTSPALTVVREEDF
jgi:hypothetical protein